MKKAALLMLSIFALSNTVIASEVTYENSNGCSVVVETRTNGKVFWVTQDKQSTVVGVTNDLTAADFSYCSQEAINVNSFTGSNGTGIMISCSGHQNDHAFTRGQVKIDILKGELKSISVDGQRKGLLSWKQELAINCEGLVGK